MCDETCVVVHTDLKDEAEATHKRVDANGNSNSPHVHIDVSPM